MTVPFWLELTLAIALLWWVTGPTSWVSRLARKNQEYCERKMAAARDQSLREDEELVNRAFATVESLARKYLLDAPYPISFAAFKEIMETIYHVIIEDKNGMVTVNYVWDNHIYSRAYPHDFFFPVLAKVPHVKS